MKRIASYSSYTHVIVDRLHFHATKRTYRLLALAILAKVFNAEPPEVHLELTHKKSHIREIVLDYHSGGNQWEGLSGYDKLPSTYTYWPRAIAECQEKLINHEPKWALPLFNLTDTNNVGGTRPDELESRDIVRCAGSDFGNIMFADLLLNASLPGQDRTEISLECEHGFGGVGVGSADITLWLPKSPYFVSTA